MQLNQFSTSLQLNDFFISLQLNGFSISLQLNKSFPRSRSASPRKEVKEECPGIKQEFWWVYLSNICPNLEVWENRSIAMIDIVITAITQIVTIMTKQFVVTLVITHLLEACNNQPDKWFEWKVYFLLFISPKSKSTVQTTCETLKENWKSRSRCGT